MLTEKEKNYLDDLILNDLLEGEDFLEITPEGIDQLKKYTFQKGIIDRIGWEQYTWNMRKILKYQYDTGAPINVLLKTIISIVSIYGKEKSEKYGVDCCIIMYLMIGENFGYDVIKNDPDFFNEENKDREENREISSLGFYMSIYSEGDSDGSDKDYMTLMRNVFESIGYEEGYNFLKITNKKLKGLWFSIVYLMWSNGIKLDVEQRRLLFNPWNISYVYHPFLTKDWNLNKATNRYRYFYKEYSRITEYSREFTKFIYDSFYFQILRKREPKKKKIIQFIQDFKRRSKDVEECIKSHTKMRKFDDKEFEIMKNQFLYLDMMESRYRVEVLFEELPIEDLRRLFDYFHSSYRKTIWYKYGDKENQNSILYQWYVIFELSRLFLHKQIKKEHFDWLNSIYSYATDKKNARVGILYNLTMGKFSLSFTRIGTEYFLQGYNLLLKQTFKNFWLGTPGKDLEKFKEIGKEALNIEYGEEENSIPEITEFQDDIYPKEYMEEIFNKYDVAESDYDDILYTLGYKSRAGFILKDNYKSFNEYVGCKVEEGNNIYFEKTLVKNITIYNVLADYCRDYKLFKVDDELYIPLVKTEKRGLTTQYIDSFFQKLKSKFGEKEFFTISNIRDKINTDVIDGIGFGDEFLENIIFYKDGISSIKIGDHRIFTYLFKKPTIISFIEEEMKKYKIISVADFSEKVSNEYKLDINYNIIIRNVSRLENVFYAKTLDKLYLNKEDFYNELS